MVWDRVPDVPCRILDLPDSLCPVELIQSKDGHQPAAVPAAEF